jgi:hypothetical protein
MKLKLVLLGLLILFIMTPFSQAETASDTGATTVTTTVVALFEIVIGNEIPLSHFTARGEYSLPYGEAETLEGNTPLTVYTNVIGLPHTLVAYDGDDNNGVPTNTTDDTITLDTFLRVGSSDLTSGEVVLVTPTDLINSEGTGTTGIDLLGAYAYTRGENPLQLDVELDTTWEDAPGDYYVNVNLYGSATY